MSEFVVLAIIALIAFIIITLFTDPKKKNSGIGSGSSRATNPLFQNIDKYRTVEEVSQALRKAGLESSNIIFAIDFTQSNVYQGERTFGGRSLHHLEPIVSNPYQKVISLLGKTLEPFDDDHLIPAYGFGDSTTKGHSVFSFLHGETPCRGFQQVLERYAEIVPSTQLSGPTNFAPAINKAIEIVKKTKSYHILVIVADGQVTSEKATRDAIVHASNYALSIVLVGVGDGPWDMMTDFDDRLPQRKFDNFQFVNFHKAVTGSDFPDAAFSLHSLMEIPDQFLAIRKLGLLD